MNNIIFYNLYFFIHSFFPFVMHGNLSIKWGLFHHQWCDFYVEKDPLSHYRIIYILLSFILSLWSKKSKIFERTFWSLVFDLNLVYLLTILKWYFMIFERSHFFFERRRFASLEGVHQFRSTRRLMLSKPV